MDTQKTILAELSEISPILAEKRPGHPYTVPQGFFDAFPGTVLAEVSPELPAPESMPMDVPAGYFDGLAAAILDRIKASATVEEGEHSEILAGIGKAMPYQVPAGYFESLDQTVASVTWNEQTPSVLTLIDRKMPYQLPDGYFRSLPAQILQKTRAIRKEAPVYPMSFVRRVYRYAAAAILVGIVSVGALMYFRSGNNPDKPSVAAVDMNTISSDELQNYVSGLDVIETDNSIIASNNDIEAEDLKEFLNDMPEQALQQYVQEYAQPNTN